MGHGLRRAAGAASEIDRDNGGFYQSLAADSFSRGEVCWALYFLDAADYWAPASGEVVSERIGMLLGAMKDLSEERVWQR